MTASVRLSLMTSLLWQEPFAVAFGKQDGNPLELRPRQKEECWGCKIRERSWSPDSMETAQLPGHTRHLLTFSQTLNKKYMWNHERTQTNSNKYVRFSHVDETVHRVFSQHLEVQELPNVKRIREESQIMASHLLGMVGLNVVRHEKSTAGTHGTKIWILWYNFWTFYMKICKDI